MRNSSSGVATCRLVVCSGLCGLAACVASSSAMAGNSAPSWRYRTFMQRFSAGLGVPLPPPHALRVVGAEAEQITATLGHVVEGVQVAVPPALESQ